MVAGGGDGVIPEQAAAGIRAASQVLNIAWMPRRSTRPRASSARAAAPVRGSRRAACSGLQTGVSTHLEVEEGQSHTDMSTRPYWMHLRGWNCIPVLPSFSTRHLVNEAAGVTLEVQIKHLSIYHSVNKS